MSKITIQDLASVLVERWHLGKKEASMFVNELFFVIQKSLDEEKNVKVKGLGTFKIIDVDDRESVDVNTGDRVLIEGHGKITFTPDALMKELVNKPFSQFETVVLNEGVDFKEAAVDQPEETPDVVLETEDSAAPLVEFVDEPQTETQEIQETPEIPVVPEEPVKVFEKQNTPKEPDIPAAPEKLVEQVPTQQEPISAETEEDNTEKSPDESEEPDASEEPELLEKENVFKKYYKWIGIAVLTLAIGILIGYLMGNRPSNTSDTQQSPSAETVEKEVATNLPKDSAIINKEADVEDEIMEEDEDAEEAEEDEDVTDDVEAKEEERALDKWETMDARVRTGAYRIVGTDTIVKAKAGDKLTRIANRLLGPGMECYLEVYNGLSSGAVLSAGQEIKIPKLELKKKRRK
jgi:nucleoid DNA-binding protein